MGSIIDKPCYVVFRHLRKLFLEYTFQACQYDGALPSSVIVDYTKLDLAVALLDNSRLLGKRDNTLDCGRSTIIGGRGCGWRRVFLPFWRPIWRFGGRLALSYRWPMVSLNGSQRYIWRRRGASSLARSRRWCCGGGGIAQHIAELRHVLAGRTSECKVVAEG